MVAVGPQNGPRLFEVSRWRPAPAHVVARPVILEGLGASAHATVVPAPAGSGKTVFCSRGSARRGRWPVQPVPTPCHT